MSTGVCLDSVGKVRHIHVNIFENRGEDLDVVDVDEDEDENEDEDEDDDDDDDDDDDGDGDDANDEHDDNNDENNDDEHDDDDDIDAVDEYDEDTDENAGKKTKKRWVRQVASTGSPPVFWWCDSLSSITGLSEMTHGYAVETTSF